MKCSMLLLLIFAVARINYGIWDSDIPLGDEAGSIEQSFALFKEGFYSSNLYLDSYIICFKYITEDPIVAYYYVRFIASLLSVSGLFLLLFSLNWVSPFGAFVAALLWNLNSLVTPLIQHSNIRLFAFALACFAGFLWISNFGKSAKLFSIVILLLTVGVRVEYALLLVLMAVHVCANWLDRLKSDGWTKQRFLEFCIAAGVVLIPIGAIVLSAYYRNSAIEFFSYLDDYLFLGLQQCYSSFLVERNTGLHIDPMTEYDFVMDKSFPGASGFFEAILINPIEIVKYFSLNTINNLINSYHLLSTHSFILPTKLVVKGWQGSAKVGYLNYILWAEQIVVCLGIAVSGIWLVISKSVNVKTRQIWKTDSLFFILSLASVSVTSLVLHIPIASYWITVIPLLYWGPAALISKYCCKCSNMLIMCISLLLTFAFFNPVFTSSMNIAAHRDKDLVLNLRDKLSSLTKTHLKVLGAWPDPLLAFTIPGRGQSTCNFDVRKGTSYEELVMLKGHDLVVIDTWMRESQQYKIEQEFFDKFIKRPEMYGYQLLLSSEKRDGSIYVFKLSKT